MTKFTRLILYTALVATLRLGAQVAAPSPLSEPLAAAGNVPGGWIADELRANAALQAGFARTAVAIYQEILRNAALPVEVHQRVVLGRVTALLDVGDLSEAERRCRLTTGRGIQITN